MIAYEPIGVIHSPYTSVGDMPIQAAAASRVQGRVEVLPEYAGGLADLDGFSHIILLYHFHLAGPPQLTVVPFLDRERRGVFATRAPLRPNPIGLSVVRLVGVAGNILTIEGIDAIDGTPLLDIKPYIPMFDHHEGATIGWLAGHESDFEKKRSDDRFK
jgi:tRNA-Thr(GGU) m(6)t(6)A37 methyltransferase TsaA